VSGRDPDREAARPVLEYGTTRRLPLTRRSEPASMRRWRGGLVWSIASTIVGGLIWLPIAVAGMVAIFVCCAMTLISMAQYAAANRGRAYAVRHTLLAIALTPLALIGIFAVSRLVESDIERWHLDADDEPRDA
jgi:hypothetical protein